MQGMGLCRRALAGWSKELKVVVPPEGPSWGTSPQPSTNMHLIQQHMCRCGGSRCSALKQQSIQVLSGKCGANRALSLFIVNIALGMKRLSMKIIHTHLCTCIHTVYTPPNHSLTATTCLNWEPHLLLQDLALNFFFWKGNTTLQTNSNINIWHIFKYEGWCYKH